MMEKAEQMLGEVLCEGETSRARRRKQRGEVEWRQEVIKRPLGRPSDHSQFLLPYDLMEQQRIRVAGKEVATELRDC